MLFREAEAAANVADRGMRRYDDAVVGFTFCAIVSMNDSHPRSALKFDGVSEGRRRNMQANRSKDTKPEMMVRQALHRFGYRYRLHRSDLPGKPDLVFPSRLKIVEVRGCFWHGHGCVPLGMLPKTRIDYWEPKILGNKGRDAKNLTALRLLGWEVFEIWECDIRASPDVAIAAIVEFLGPAASSHISQRKTRKFVQD